MLDKHDPGPQRSAIETPQAGRYSPDRGFTTTPLCQASLWLHAAAALGLALRPAAWRWALGAVAANHALIAGAGLWPRNAALGPVLTRLGDRAAEQGLVALTFDDGPDPEATPRVLDLLAAHGAGASFFCVGHRARAMPELIGEIVRRGHSVENHTDRHPFAFACYGSTSLRREIAAAQQTLTALGGTPPRFFRAPMGFRNPLLGRVLARAGLTLTAWTRRGHDGLCSDPEAVLSRLLAGLRAGDILMLHDSARMRTATGEPVVLAVLPRLLATLRASGLRAVSLPRAFEAAPS